MVVCLGLSQTRSLKARVSTLDQGKALGGQRRRGKPGAAQKAHAPLAFDRIDRGSLQHRLQNGTGRGNVGHMIPPHHTMGAGGVDIAEKCRIADILDHGGQRLIGRSSVQPMPGLKVSAIAPQRLVQGKGRERPGIPSPSKRTVKIQHRPFIAQRGRVVGRITPEPHHGGVIGHLHQIITLAGRELGQRGFRRFRIEKLVRLIGTLVDGRTAIFDKAEGLRLRDPRGGRGLAHPGNARMVLRQPPIAQILIAVDPRLVMGAIGDGGAGLRGLIELIGVIPVKPLAARDIGDEVIWVIKGLPCAVGVHLPFAPI